MKLLFDLFPIILFFASFKVWGIFTATAVTIAATLAQVVWCLARHRKVDPMLWMSFAIVTVFGSATLILHNEMFIKWKPTILYWTFAIALALAQFVFGKNPIRAMMGKQMELPPRVWGQLGVVWAIFFALFGAANLFVVYHFSTNGWANFKMYGTLGLFVAFIIGQSLWLSRYISDEKSAAHGSHEANAKNEASAADKLP